MQTADQQPLGAACSRMGVRIGNCLRPASPGSLARSHRLTTGSHPCSGSLSRLSGRRGRCGHTCRNDHDTVWYCQRGADLAPRWIRPTSRRSRLGRSCRVRRFDVWTAPRGHAQWQRAAATTQLGSFCAARRRAGGRASARSRLCHTAARSVHRTAHACNALPLPA